MNSCGLSILTNYLRDNYGIPPFQIYKYSNSSREEALKNSEGREIVEKAERATEELKRVLPTLSILELKRLSAELNALFSYYRGELDPKGFHLLFATDTY